MSYSGKLFGVIPYDVRIGDIPYYDEVDIEAMLGLHYGSVASVLVFVESVFNDDKHAGNLLYVECLYDGGKDQVWFSHKNDEDGVGFVFNSRKETDISAMYSHQIDYAVTKHFTHDRQLTLLAKDKIDRKFDFDLQAKVVQSAKDYVAMNRRDLDKIINSDTPARVGILIRAHLAGISFTPFDNPSDILQKIEDEVKKEHAYMKEPPKGERVYDAWIQIENFRELFDKHLQEFMDRNTLKLVIFETNPQYAIRSAFEHWSMYQNISDYKSPWEAFNKFFEDNKNNQWYFAQDEKVVNKAFKVLRKLEDKLEESDRQDLFEAVQNIVASNGRDGFTLAYREEDMIDDNLEHAQILSKHWSAFKEYSKALGVEDLSMLQEKIERVTGNPVSENMVLKVCEELGITQKELADMLGVSKPSVERWAQGETPEQAVNQINLLLENTSLKKELKELKNAIKTITKYAN